MSDALKDFLASGKKLLNDTKTPRKAPEPANTKKGSLPNPALGSGEPVERDPHKLFIRRVVKEKPSKKEVVEQFEKFIEQAESQL